MATVPARPWFWRAGIAAGVMTVWCFASLFANANRGYHPAGRSRPFQRELPQSRTRVLVVGDSTGVGTGAHRAEDSIAGLLAWEFPDVAVANRARNGSKAADALRQIEGLPSVDLPAGHFDVIFVHVGGNDILRATPLPQLEHDITAVLRAARRRADTVIFMSAPNMGLCPAFFPPFSWLLTMRARQARDLFVRISKLEDVIYIDLFRERAEDVYSRVPGRYFAGDQLHPSSECYRAAYHAICDGAPLHRVLRPPGVNSSEDVSGST